MILAARMNFIFFLNSSNLKSARHTRMGSFLSLIKFSLCYVSLSDNRPFDIVRTFIPLRNYIQQSDLHRTLTHTTSLFFPEFE